MTALVDDSFVYRAAKTTHSSVSGKIDVHLASGHTDRKLGEGGERSKRRERSEVRRCSYILQQAVPYKRAKVPLRRNATDIVVIPGQPTNPVPARAKNVLVGFAVTEGDPASP